MSLYLYKKYDLIFCGTADEMDSEDRKHAENKQDIDKCVEFFISDPVLYDLTMKLLEGINNPIIGIDFKILDSSGSSVAIIMTNSDLVYQIYKSKELYHKIIKFYDRLKNKEYVVQMIDKKPEINTIVWKKITPLHEKGREYIKTHRKKIKKELEKGLVLFSDSGLRHGDSTLDNAGMTTDDRYVWYDFDSSKLSPNLGADTYLLNKSLKFWLN